MFMNKNYNSKNTEESKSRNNSDILVAYYFQNKELL